MKKEVYNKNIPHCAGNHGLFEYGTFRTFLNALENTDLVQEGGDLYGTEHRLVYHIEPEGITLSYRSWMDVKGWKVKIELNGSEKDLGKIEKKLLEKDKEFLKT